jgi:hypothetical protein
VNSVPAVVWTEKDVGGGGGGSGGGKNNAMSPLTPKTNKLGRRVLSQSFLAIKREKKGEGGRE